MGIEQKAGDIIEKLNSPNYKTSSDGRQEVIGLRDNTISNFKNKIYKVAGTLDKGEADKLIGLLETKVEELYGVIYQKDFLGINKEDLRPLLRLSNVTEKYLENILNTGIEDWTGDNNYKLDTPEGRKKAIAHILADKFIEIEDPKAKNRAETYDKMQKKAMGSEYR